MQGILVLSFKDEWIQENVDVISRHDRAIHELEIKIVSLAAEIKVIRSLVSIAAGAVGLVGTIVAIIKVLN